MKRSPLKLRVRIERDSVCAGDDMDAPHAKVIPVHPDYSLTQLLQAVLHPVYLSRIVTGCATWIALAGERPLAVITQQCSEPKFLVSPDTRIAECLDLNSPRALFFRYCRQADPDLVYQCLKNGDPLPNEAR